MAIALRAAGSWTATTGDLVVNIPTTPSTPQAGDLMLVLYGGKPYSDLAVPLGGTWSASGTLATDGTVAAGIDVGSMMVNIIYKIHTGTESAVTIQNNTNNVSSGVMLVFSKAADKEWDLQFGGGGMGTASLTFSATSTTTFSYQVDDVLVAYNVLRSDAASPGAPTLSASSITFSAFTSNPATAFTTTSGGDMSARSGYSTVTAGNAIGNLTFTSSLSASHTGSFAAVRLREVTPPYRPIDPFGSMGIFGL